MGGYRWLSANYNPGDKIYLFGSYGVRRLVYLLMLSHFQVSLVVHIKSALLLE